MAVAQDMEVLDRGAGKAARGCPPEAPAQSLVRKVCLFLSNAILQFPTVFELQQRALNQPTLLRSEVEQELARMAGSGQTFKVLDYGCGSGTYTGLFQPDKYVGIDCNDAMLGRAASVHPSHTFIRATNLSGISAQLDNISEVLMIGVVHHLSDQDFLTIVSALPRSRPIRLLTIDTLKCEGGLGSFIQHFERGEYLRTESDHRRLLARVADEVSYKKVPYGRHFELAVFRGVLKPVID